MKSFRILALIGGFLVAGAGAFGQQSVPSGTILPVRLDSTLSSKSQTGKPITATIMQDVRLSNGIIIHRGAKVRGEVVDVAPPDDSHPARISFRFDKLMNSKQASPIAVNLRAMASIMEVDEAQIPQSGPDYGTPKTDWTTQQIGGDIVYRGGGPVMEGSENVGEPVYDGVMTQVNSNPDGDCRGAIDGNNDKQALWVFSADACGAYGLANVQIAHAGRTEPAGEITLESKHGALHVPRGTGMLLRVNESAGKKA